MLYSVAIAVCLSSTPVSECREPTAVDWVIAPSHPTSMSGCMILGMQYAAELNLVMAGSYAKVFCTAGNRRSR